MVERKVAGSAGGVRMAVGVSVGVTVEVGVKVGVVVAVGVGVSLANNPPSLQLVSIPSVSKIMRRITILFLCSIYQACDREFGWEDCIRYLGVCQKGLIT